METDAGLPLLVQRNDHLNVLRYVRVHQLREPALVVAHGRRLLDSGRLARDDLTRLAVLEQVCLAALDAGDPDTAAWCLDGIRGSGVAEDSVRLRRLTARCLEAAGDFAGAEIIYDELLKENPTNLAALKRKYCILKAQPGRQVEAVDALNQYLQQNYSDTAAWYEMSQVQMELGDYEGAAFALEEAILGSASDASLHLRLAECYATVGGLENLLLARKHCSQALELDPEMRRAQLCLVVIANAYVLESSKQKNADFHEDQVARELLRHGAKHLMEAYAGTQMLPDVSDLINQYEDGM